MNMHTLHQFLTTDCGGLLTQDIVCEDLKVNLEFVKLYNILLYLKYPPTIFYLQFRYLSISKVFDAAAVRNEMTYPRTALSLVVANSFITFAAHGCLQTCFGARILLVH